MKEAAGETAPPMWLNGNGGYGNGGYGNGGSERWLDGKVRADNNILAAAFVIYLDNFFSFPPDAM